MSDLGTPFTRWRDRETGQLLVAIAAKDDGGVCMVLPIRSKSVPHPLDWMSRAVFLRKYERVQS